jgi:ribosomal protein S18 acetylase RimI-like enzyme
MHERKHQWKSALAGLIRIDTASIPRAAELLARAFQDDPLMTYAFPDAVRRARLLPQLIGLNVRYGCLFGEVYATPSWEGAAVWLPPGGQTMTPWRVLRAGMLAAPLRVDWAALGRLALIQEQTTRLHRRHALPGHWYLSQIGVEPVHQAQGWGGALLRPLLARLDAARCWCYLDTTQEAAIPFYQKWGFAIAAETDTIRGGPHLWAMLRAPAEHFASPSANTEM